MLSLKNTIIGVHRIYFIPKTKYDAHVRSNFGLDYSRQNYKQLTYGASCL